MEWGLECTSLDVNLLCKLFRLLPFAFLSTYSLSLQL